MIIDVQLGMFDESDPVYAGGELLTTLTALIAQARSAGLPIIFVQHDGEGNHPLRPDKPGWALHPALRPAPADLLIRKRHPDAFQGTALQQELQARGIKNLIIAGIQTEFCVDATCRRAYSLDYAVTLVQDGHSTWNAGQLTAPQIIAHHNLTLGGWFVTLKAAQDILFI
jgi:nicotinamidase-related amidase